MFASSENAISFYTNSLGERGSPGYKGERGEMGPQGPTGKGVVSFKNYQLYSRLSFSWFRTEVLLFPYDIHYLLFICLL